MDENFNKDYVEKIKSKLIYNSTISDKQEAATDINNMIVLMNYCFLKKNNFFIDNFNKRVIKTVCLTYNKIKTNILTSTVFDLFDNVSYDGIRSIRFIIINSINNYSIIKQNNNELCSIISRDSLKRCLVIINNVLKLKSPDKK